MHFTEGNWTNSGCWLSFFDVWYAECTCNHLTEFSLRLLKEANTDNNAAATTDISSVSEYDSDTNNVPIILISTIIGIYVTVFIYLYRIERNRRR